MMVLVEGCVDSVASARAAERGGAGRLELCAALSDGGTTPSLGMIEAVVAAVRIPVFAIIRPRGGDFVYSEDELEVMQRDADHARKAGAAGIVVGALQIDGAVNVTQTRAVIHASGGLPATFHRAFDLTPDRSTALETLIAIGVERVLTSGGAASALAGADEIRRLGIQATGRITIMAGGGLREENVAEVVRRSGVGELHVRGAGIVHGASRAASIGFRKALPTDEDAWEETDERLMANLVRVVNEA